MSSARALELLGEHPLFKLATPASLERLVRHSALKTYRAGASICTAGLRQTHVFILFSGSIVLRRRNKEANTQILVGTVTSPAIFGDAEAFSPGQQWLVSARAAETTVALCVPNVAFEALIEAEGKLAAALYKDACARHYLSVSIMQVHALQRTQHKMLRLLRKLGPEGEAPIKQVELAKALGINRKTVARNLADLEGRGLIVRHGNKVQLAAEGPTFAELQGGVGARWGL